MIGFEARSVRVEASPYAHVAIDAALRDFDGLARDFPSPERFGPHIRSHGDLTDPDESYHRLLEESAAYRRLHDWVYSSSFCEFFLDVFATDIEAQQASGALLRNPLSMEIRPQPYEGRRMLGRARAITDDAFLFPRLDLGIGRVGYGRVNGGKGVHVDNLTRLVSVLVYVEDNPSMAGGEHRMFALKGYEPVIDKVYRPRANLLIASLQSNLALHDVNPVTQITGVRKAFYMAVSCSAEIWRAPEDRRLGRLTGSRYQPSSLERAAGRLRRLFR